MTVIIYIYIYQHIISYHIISYHIISYHHIYVIWCNEKCTILCWWRFWCGQFVLHSLIFGTCWGQERTLVNYMLQIPIGHDIRMIASCFLDDLLAISQRAIEIVTGFRLRSGNTHPPNHHQTISSFTPHPLPIFRVPSQAGFGSETRNLLWVIMILCVLLYAPWTAVVYLQRRKTWRGPHDINVEG